MGRFVFLSASDGTLARSSRSLVASSSWMSSDGSGTKDSVRGDDSVRSGLAITVLSADAAT